MASFSLRIVDADFYLESPLKGLDVEFSEQRKSKTARVPVIRIFGATPQGQKACLHIHQVFPYCYTLVPKGVVDYENLGFKLAASLDVALHVALGKSVSLQQQYVHKIEVIKGFPFYGYYQDHTVFFKIYLYNPGLIKRVGELLLSGSILNQVFQPYECHIPFVMQFFIDFNLHGMNFIHMSEVRFRHPIPSDIPDFAISSPMSPSLSPTGSSEMNITNIGVWHVGSVARFKMLPPEIKRQTTCSLELDGMQSHIMNKVLMEDCLGRNPGLIAIWDDEKERKRLNSEDSNIELPESQDREMCGPLERECQYLAQLKGALGERLNNMHAKSPLLHEDGADALGDAASGSDNLTPLALSSSLDLSLVDILANLDRSCLEHQSLLAEGEPDLKESLLAELEEEEQESILMSSYMREDVSQAQRIKQLSDNVSTSNRGGSYAYEISDLEIESDMSSDDERHDDQEVNINETWSASWLDSLPQFDGVGPCSLTAGDSDSVADYISNQRPDGGSVPNVRDASRSLVNHAVAPFEHFIEKIPQVDGAADDVSVGKFRTPRKRSHFNTGMDCTAVSPKRTRSYVRARKLSFEKEAHAPACDIPTSGNGRGEAVSESFKQASAVPAQPESPSVIVPKSCRPSRNQPRRMVIEPIKIETGASSPGFGLSSPPQVRGSDASSVLNALGPTCKLHSSERVRKGKTKLDGRSFSRKTARLRHATGLWWPSSPPSPDFGLDYAEHGLYTPKSYDSDSLAKLSARAVDAHESRSADLSVVSNTDYSKLSIKTQSVSKTCQSLKPSISVQLMNVKVVVEDVLKTCNRPKLSVGNSMTPRQLIKGFSERQGFVASDETYDILLDQKEALEDAVSYGLPLLSCAEPPDFADSLEKIAFDPTMHEYVMPDFKALSFQFCSEVISASARESTEVLARQAKQATDAALVVRPEETFAAVRNESAEEFVVPCTPESLQGEPSLERLEAAISDEQAFNNSVISDEHGLNDSMMTDEHGLNNSATSDDLGMNISVTSDELGLNKSLMSDERGFSKSSAVASAALLPPGHVNNACVVLPPSRNVDHSPCCSPVSNCNNSLRECDACSRSCGAISSRTQGSPAKLLSAAYDAVSLLRRGAPKSSFVITPRDRPPTRESLLSTSSRFNLTEAIHLEAFYGRDADIPEVSWGPYGKPIAYGRTAVADLPPFASLSQSDGALRRFQTRQVLAMDISMLATEEDCVDALTKNKSLKYVFLGNRELAITPCKPPPSPASVFTWLANQSETLPLLGTETTLASEHLNNTPTGTAATQETLTISPMSPDMVRHPGERRTSLSPCVARRAVAAVPEKDCLRTQVGSSPAKRKARRSRVLHYAPVVEIRSPSKVNTCVNHALRAVDVQVKERVGSRIPVDSSQIEGPSLNNTYGFDVSTQNARDAKAIHVVQHLTILSIELHVQTRRELHPDPAMDNIEAIFYRCTSDFRKPGSDDSGMSGCFLVDKNAAVSAETPHGREDTASNASQIKNLSAATPQGKLSALVTNLPLPSMKSALGPGATESGANSAFLFETGLTQVDFRCFPDEKDMLVEFAKFVQTIDPDILLGYEVQMTSWGYLVERAGVLEVNIVPMLSRVPDKEKAKSNQESEDRDALFWGQLSSIAVTGRILLNVWRIMRFEVVLQIYSFENVVYHVLHRRLPRFSFRSLTDWWCGKRTRWRVVAHYMARCRATVEMLERLDFINRTSELARVFGILFYEVISRGSQFRVESMMLRIAKPMSYVPVSPSVQQRSKMAAPEVIPLVMEPESRFYVDPVLVLDFQSLYPSIIIAYNYCFSTCLGKMNLFSHNETFKFGATSLTLPLAVLQKLVRNGQVHLSPNGVGFVTSEVRKGVLPSMLEEILRTRIMVKNAMKKATDDKVLFKMLDSRQLGLKLIANVTYGYTSAHFSGRMPCVEIGDSVVRKARETLERAIDIVNNTSKWGARVVYGDTDSMFVLVRGASKERAFAVGKEIAEEITALNPKPVKLKFEKVYLPCVLLTKKRYVGYMYESLQQVEPKFDAKGIETVRRDNCPAVGKILEKSLRLLFETRDLSLVKSYVQRQFMKLLEGRVSLQDFIFAKEYRGSGGYKPAACVPALFLARKMLAQDRRAEPRSGERVPYVVVHGDPCVPLIQLVRSPWEVLSNSNLRLNATYYITKQICPALGRVFSLLGVDVQRWFAELPKISRVQDREANPPGHRKKGTISQYFASTHCPICEDHTLRGLCVKCESDPQTAVTVLAMRTRAAERKLMHLKLLCQHCAQTADTKTGCISLDCPVFHKMNKAERGLAVADNCRHLCERFT